MKTAKKMGRTGSSRVLPSLLVDPWVRLIRYPGLRDREIFVRFLTRCEVGERFQPTQVEVGMVFQHSGVRDFDLGGGFQHSVLAMVFQHRS